VWDGSQLLQQCTATIGAQMAFCFGYIDAVADSLLVDNDVCLSNQVDDPQLRDIVVRFLTDNPRLRRLSAPDLINRALVGAFPCR
jgi:hypothetical protein